MGTGALARQVKRLQKGGLWVQQVQVLLLAFTISVLTLSVRSGRIALIKEEYLPGSVNIVNSGLCLFFQPHQLTKIHTRFL